MVFIPAAFTYKVTQVYTQDDNYTAVNVFHHTHGLGSFTTIADVMYETHYNWYLNFRRGLLQDTWRLTTVEVRDVSVENGQVQLFTTPAGFHGTINAQIDVLANAMTVTWQTPYAGKQRRGRTYVCGISAVSRNYNTWDSAIVADVQDAYVQLLDASVSGDMRMQVVSYQAAGAPREEAFLTEITGCRANAPVHKQWRRNTAP